MAGRARGGPCLCCEPLPNALAGWFSLAAATDFLLAVLLLTGLPVALVVAGLFGPTSEIVATFAWILAISFVATGAMLIAVAPAEASETE